MSQNIDTRRCPRCGGNLFLYKDRGGWYVECLQCSYTKDLEGYRAQPTGQESSFLTPVHIANGYNKTHNNARYQNSFDHNQF
jgi:ribosomal protein S27AE